MKLYWCSVYYNHINVSKDVFILCIHGAMSCDHVTNENFTKGNVSVAILAIFKFKFTAKRNYLYICCFKVYIMSVFSWFHTMWAKSIVNSQKNTTGCALVHHVKGWEKSARRGKICFLINGKCTHNEITNKKTYEFIEILMRIFDLLIAPKTHKFINIHPKPYSISPYRQSAK